jgi:hypothetical protein
MSTAQLVISQGAKTARTQTVAPWIIGAAVVIVALVVISLIRK